MTERSGVPAFSTIYAGFGGYSLEARRPLQDALIQEVTIRRLFELATVDWPTVHPAEDPERTIRDDSVSETVLHEFVAQRIPAGHGESSLYASLSDEIYTHATLGVIRHEVISTIAVHNIRAGTRKPNQRPALLLTVNSDPRERHWDFADPDYPRRLLEPGHLDRAVDDRRLTEDRLRRLVNSRKSTRRPRGQSAQ